MHITCISEAIEISRQTAKLKRPKLGKCSQTHKKTLFFGVFIFCEISVCIYCNIKRALTNIMHITSTSETLKISWQTSKKTDQNYANEIKIMCILEMWSPKNTHTNSKINRPKYSLRGALDHASRPGCMCKISSLQPLRAAIGTAAERRSFSGSDGGGSADASIRAGYTTAREN